MATMGLLFQYSYIFVQLLAVASNARAVDLFYNFTVSYHCGAPDGVTVCHILGVNGHFPGPTIEGTVGDTVHVTVQNYIQDKTQLTTIHWHGLFQVGTPFEDGPQMVTQCGIANGGSMVYSFPLQQSGTFWYHSHTGSQYTEGLWGPLIVHAATEIYAYDGELVITLSDWYHTNGSVNIYWFLSPASEGNEPIPSSHLMNGVGAFPCNATTLPCSTSSPNPPVFKVTRGKLYRIRVINSSAFATYYFSIPGHWLEVIEVDGIDTVRGRVFDRVPIAAAQRYSFLVRMNATSGDNYWIMAEVDTDMYGFDGPNINPDPAAMIPVVYGKLQYQTVLSTLSTSPGVTWTLFSNVYPLKPVPDSSSGLEFPEMSLQPADRILAPFAYDSEVILAVEQVVDDEDVNHLTFNNITFSTGTVEPLITLSIKNASFPTSANVYTIDNVQEVVQLVVNNHDTGPHPFHLHGHAFWVLGKGQAQNGDYDPSVHADQLVLNGVKRDTVTIETESWIVIRFIADNPGMWFFHCHIHWHLEGGLAMVFNEVPVMLREMKIPNQTKSVCAAVGISV